DITKSKVSVQGFGNVGSNAAKCLHDLGSKIIAVAKRDYAIYNENGIDIDELLRFNKNNKNISKFPEIKKISLDEFWKLNVDILVPAALENAITAEIANKINARIICEGANGPISPAADEILNRKGILVTPDILTNAGGVAVSYFEWVQNQYGYYWSEE